MRLSAKLSLVIPLITCTQYSFANPEEDDFSIAIMPMAFSQESIFLGGENNTVFLPLPELRWRNIFFAEGKLGATVWSDDRFSIDMSIGGDLTGDIDRGDSNILKDMTKLKTVVTANVDLAYFSDVGEFSLGVAQDISSNHKGLSVTADYSYSMTFGQFFIEPAIAVTFSDKDVANYYYGVSSADVTVNRPLYNLGSTINYDLSLTAGYAINKNNVIFASANLTLFDKDIKNSPIVIDDKAMTYGIGYRYQF